MAPLQRLSPVSAEHAWPLREGPPAWRDDPGAPWAPPTDTLSDVLAIAGVSADAQGQAHRCPVAVRGVAAGAPLYVEGSPAQAVYWVRSGAFKTVTTGEDGYEQVLGFAEPGDALGLDTLSGEAHPTAAVALADARVYAVPIARWWAETPPPELGVLLCLAVARELARRTELAHVMAAVAAEVRLARFLLQWSLRRATGHPASTLRLCMGRRDIANHLGVAPETVSRSFGLLADLGCVRVANREIEILDRPRLVAFAQHTRRHGDERPTPRLH